VNRRFVILTEGHSHPTRAKTAACVIRYCPDEVVALLDSTRAGQTSGESLGIGDVPVIGRLAEAADAKTLLIGIANPGGRIPAAWRPLLIEAIQRGMDVVSGMHEFLADDPELAAAARAHQVRLIDVRNQRIQRIATGEGLRDQCLRIHTVGQDCSVGKMLTSVELTRALQARGYDAKFAATGQTGIVVEGDGYPIDCMVADFISGAAEQLVLDHQHHEILVIEGQGSLSHPAFSGVTLGLLHGCRPHGMILCYEAGRSASLGQDHAPLVPLADLRRLYETMAALLRPSPVIGIAMNSRLLTAEQAEAERQQIEQQLGLPVCDVLRHGTDPLVQAVLNLRPAP
jgi:uncharacterized NAD-dependent epimerase/dehydratase family protein